MLVESTSEAGFFVPLFGFIISYGFGYLLGSIPFGLLLTKMAGLGDIRKVGSGNIGATNVLRTGHKGLAALTLALDALKGAVAVWIGQQYTPEMGMVAGAAAMLGHSYPVWLKYKGGKGVATAFGLSCALNLPMGLAIGFTWLTVLVLVRYSSLAAIAAALLSPLYAWLFADSKLVLFYFGACAFVWWRHRANFKRLLDGTETMISVGKKDKTPDCLDTATLPEKPADAAPPTKPE